MADHEMKDDPQGICEQVVGAILDQAELGASGEVGRGTEMQLLSAQVSL